MNIGKKIANAFQGFCSQSNTEDIQTYKIEEENYRIEDHEKSAQKTLQKQTSNQQSQKYQESIIISDNTKTISKIQQPFKSAIQELNHFNEVKPTLKENSNIMKTERYEVNIVQQQNSAIKQKDSQLYKQDNYQDSLITAQQICDGCGVLITSIMFQLNCRHVFHQECYYQMIVKEITFKKKPLVHCFCRQQIKLYKNSEIQPELFEQLMENQLENLKFHQRFIYKCKNCEFFAFCEESKCMNCDQLIVEVQDLMKTVYY